MSGVQYRTYPYGTKRRAIVIENSLTKTNRHLVQILKDEIGEGHILTFGAEDARAIAGDTGTLTFTRGGKSGDYWKFVKD